MDSGPVAVLRVLMCRYWWRLGLVIVLLCDLCCFVLFSFLYFVLLKITHLDVGCWTFSQIPTSNRRADAWWPPASCRVHSWGLLMTLPGLPVGGAVGIHPTGLGICLLFFSPTLPAIVVTLCQVIPHQPWHPVSQSRCFSILPHRIYILNIHELADRSVEQCIH